MSDKEMDKILNSKIDDKELDEITGGKCSVLGSWGRGECSGAYYSEKCAATVEMGSLCGDDDYCKINDVKYNCHGSAKYSK